MCVCPKKRRKEITVLAQFYLLITSRQCGEGGTRGLRDHGKGIITVLAVSRLLVVNVVKVEHISEAWVAIQLLQREGQ